ncbi:MAG: hypothetical protein M3463_11635 [Verrucomicrobiota bacterium]|nr:hypothetical protein [Verrucomicrobiota bacterium]
MTTIPYANSRRLLLQRALPRVLRATMLATAMLLSAVSALRSQVTYTVTNLGLLGGGSSGYSVGHDINNASQDRRYCRQLARRATQATTKSRWTPLSEQRGDDSQIDTLEPRKRCT